MATDGQMECERQLFLALTKMTDCVPYEGKEDKLTTLKKTNFHHLRRMILFLYKEEEGVQPKYVFSILKLILNLNEKIRGV